MFNIVFNHQNSGYLFHRGVKIKIDCKIEEYLNDICCATGSTLKGHYGASKKLLPKKRKLPIYLPILDDYAIPLASPDSYDCIWVSANNYLTCFTSEGITYIKFKDKSKYAISFSTYTVKQQYKKYQMLDQKRKELKKNCEKYRQFT